MMQIKCGEFTMTEDGVISRNPAEKFKQPTLPPECKIPNPDPNKFNSREDYWNECEDIEQINALREQAYRKRFYQQYHALRRLYYAQEIRRVFSGVKRRIAHLIPVRSWRESTQAERE